MNIPRKRNNRFLAKNASIIPEALDKKWSFPLRISLVNVPNPHFAADLVLFTEEILNGKLHFLCGEVSWCEFLVHKVFKEGIISETKILNCWLRRNIYWLRLVLLQCFANFATPWTQSKLKVHETFRKRSMYVQSTVCVHEIYVQQSFYDKNSWPKHSKWSSIHTSGKKNFWAIFFFDYWSLSDKESVLWHFII